MRQSWTNVWLRRSIRLGTWHRSNSIQCLRSCLSLKQKNQISLNLDGKSSTGQRELHIRSENYGDPTWGMNRGDTMELDFNYLLMCNDLMDTTHVAWVHQFSLAADATKDTPLRVSRTENGVIVHRWMADHKPTPFFKTVVEFNGNFDRLQLYEVRYPHHALIKAVFPPAGTGGPNGLLHRDTFIMDSCNFMTPTTGSKMRYYSF